MYMTLNPRLKPNTTGVKPRDQARRGEGVYRAMEKVTAEEINQTIIDTQAFLAWKKGPGGASDCDGTCEKLAEMVLRYEAQIAELKKALARK
jgi:hypothetical protein